MISTMLKHLIRLVKKIHRASCLDFFLFKMPFSVLKDRPSLTCVLCSLPYRARGWGLWAGWFGSRRGWEPSFERQHVTDATTVGPEHIREGPCAIKVGGGPHVSGHWVEPPPLWMKGCLHCWVNTSHFPLQPKPVEVQVITHHMQRYAVWFGGSMLASTVSSFLTCPVFLFLCSIEFG